MSESVEKNKKPRTSAKVKNNWNAQHYDRVALSVPKGYKELIKVRASAQGLSVNSYLLKLIDDDLNVPS